MQILSLFDALEMLASNVETGDSVHSLPARSGHLNVRGRTQCGGFIIETDAFQSFVFQGGVSSECPTLPFLLSSSRATVGTFILESPRDNSLEFARTKEKE